MGKTGFFRPRMFDYDFDHDGKVTVFDRASVHGIIDDIESSQKSQESDDGKEDDSQSGEGCNSSGRHE